MIKQFHANSARLRRHQRMRRHLIGLQERPRLSVFRSGHHIYAQIIDDATGRTLVAASSLEETLQNFKPAAETAPTRRSKTAGEKEDPVEMAAEVVPSKGKGAKTEKAATKAQ